MKKLSFAQEIQFATSRVFREFVPRQEDRVPITWWTLPSALAYVVPCLFMAYLVRRRDTYLLRLLLLPSVIAITTRCAFRYTLEGPAAHSWGDLQAMLPIMLAARALDFAFAKEGRFKTGEKTLRAVGEVAPPPPSAKEGSEPNSAPRTVRTAVLPVWLDDAFDVLSDCRGVGWDYGRGLCVPKSPRPQERGPFLRATLAAILWQYVFFDLCDTAAKAIPGVGTLEGGSIFFPALPPLSRYAVSTAICVLGGCMLISAFALANDCCAVLGIVLLGHAPAAYPPMMDRPFRASSLHDFWARRWHQLLRSVFLTYGAPGQWIAGSAGRVVGAFVASGLYHQIGMQIDDSRVLLFFALQPAGIALEKAWRSMTGRRVGGVLGWLWTALWVVGLGQMGMDAWMQGGLMGALLVPETMSPTRRLLLPAVRRLIPAQDVALRLSSLLGAQS